MLLMDTSQHPVEDRGEVLRSGLAGLAGVDLAPIEGDGLTKMRFRAWDMVDGCSLLRAEGTGFEFIRRPARDWRGEPPVIGFSMMHSGQARLSQHGRQDAVPDGGMFLVEMTEEFTCQLAERSLGINLLVPLDVLDLPLRDVRTAAQWLPLSPVYGLACEHLRTMVGYAERFDAPHPSAQQAALHMLRALVKSFGAD